MKTLLLIMLVILVIFPTIASAKTIFFVTSQTTTLQTCNGLTGDDMAYCTELQKLGHTVVVYNENAVVNDAWANEVKSADMIFLGNISDKITNATKPENAYFFSNIFSKKNVSVFSTSINNYYSDVNLRCPTPPTPVEVGPSGAALLSSGCTGIVSGYANSALKNFFQIYKMPSDNICETHIFKMRDSGYINQKIHSPIDIYLQSGPIAKPSFIANTTLNSEQNVKIWITDLCTPRNRNAALYYASYPTIFSVDNFMFFGPSVPQQFTPTMWGIFDRSVLYMLNDYGLNFSYSTIPEYPTADGKIFVFVSTPVKNVSINMTFENSIKQLSFNNKTGFYESGEVSLGKANSFAINAETADGSRSGNASLKTGVDSIKITSVSAVRKDSVVSLRVAAENSSTIAESKYKLWKSVNSTINATSPIAVGKLSLKDGVFQADANVSESEMILEIDMNTSSGKAGGVYRPLSVSAKPSIGKDYSISPEEWLLSYASPKSVSSTITISALKMNITGLKISKSGNLSNALSFFLTNMSTDLQQGKSTSFNVVLDLSKISNKSQGKILISANEFDAEIPVEAIVDSAISGSKWLSINPKSWKSAIPKGNVQAKTFNLTSLGPYHANEISFEADGEFAGLLSAEKISFVKAGFDKQAKLSLDTKSLSPGKHSGKINVFSSIGNDSVNVEIEIVQDFSGEIASLRQNMTETENLVAGFENKTAEASDAQQKLSDARSALDEVESKWASQDYEGAKLGLADTKQKFEIAYAAAKSLKPPLPILEAAIVAVVLIIFALLYKFRDKILNKFKKKKIEIPEEEPSEGEEKYKPPSEGDEGYRPQYY